ncbi:Mu transposase C-terminal domain-containing protein [Kitasatospora sp. NPDC090091]|uniref:Mu transposase C-terminal domain-containing protein n=1 Tax=Kitasatospora sp. NPDC090091 TaxID=3364081 RepID=UPI00380C5FE8
MSSASPPPSSTTCACWPTPRPRRPRWCCAGPPPPRPVLRRLHRRSPGLRHLVEHRTPPEGLNGHTPLQTWQQDPTPLTDIPPTDLWSFTLEDDGRTRVITSHGVRFRNRDYLADWMTGQAGREVRVRFMPHHTHGRAAPAASRLFCCLRSRTSPQSRSEPCGGGPPPVGGGPPFLVSVPPPPCPLSGTGSDALRGAGCGVAGLAGSSTSGRCGSSVPGAGGCLVRRR